MLSVAEIGLGAVSSVGHGDDVTRGSWIGNCSNPSTSCTDTLITSGCFVAFLLEPFLYLRMPIYLLPALSIAVAWAAAPFLFPVLALVL